MLQQLFHKREALISINMQRIFTTPLSQYVRSIEPIGYVSFCLYMFIKRAVHACDEKQIFIAQIKSQLVHLIRSLYYCWRCQ